MEGIPEVVLNSGMKMPLIGMGTAAFPLPDPLFLRSAIVDAIELGYRHFDTARLYKSEKPLGDAIAEALERGLISSRDELFITSKLWCTDAHSDLVLPALQETLRNLGLDHVDLYLIHFPVRLKGGEKDIMTLPHPKEDILPIDLKSTWEAMEECHKLGLAKSIGVSNFSCKKLESLLAHARIPPAVNQVEMHPLWQQKTLRQFCDERVIHVSAWSPLGGSGTPWGSNAVLDCPELKEIAEAKGKSLAQTKQLQKEWYKKAYGRMVGGIVEQLVKFGKVTRPILGIKFAPNQSLEQLEVSGVLMLDALANGLAGKAF